MTVVAVSLFALSVLMLAWSYLLYPPLVGRISSRASSAKASEARASATKAWELAFMAGAVPRAPLAPSSLEVLISAADEEAVIGARVTNLLAQEFRGPYRVTIGCDGSRDRTAQRAREAGDERVHVLEFGARRGKAAVLNDLVAASDADLVVFTDANTRFEPGAIGKLADAFRDPEVGAACGRLVLEGSDVENAFWEQETRIKEAEGRLGVCLGANGAIYAARRSDVEPLPPDTTSMDDFLIPVRIARRGRRVVFVGDAVAREEAARDSRAEMRRRFRIGVGAGQVLRRELWLWNVPRHPRLSLAYFSRKVARWLAPVALLAGSVAAVASPSLRPIGATLLGALLLLALSARALPRLPGLAGRLYYFGVINLALTAGVIAGLVGYSRPAWKPVPRLV